MIPRSYLVKMAELVSCNLDSGATLFEVCESLVKHFLPEVSDEVRLSYLKHRKVLMSKNITCCAEDLLKFDESAAMLDKDDMRDIAKEQEEADTKVNEYSQYRVGWTERRQAVRSATSGASGSTARRSNARNAPVVGKKRALPSDVALTQESAKPYLPPGGFLWKARGNNSWCCRLPPYSQVSRSWRKHGEQGALILCLRHCWDQYLEDEGMRQADCPVTNLYQRWDLGDMCIEGVGPPSARAQPLRVRARPA